MRQVALRGKSKPMIMPCRLRRTVHTSKVAGEIDNG